MSTVQVKLSGLASGLPALSIALTEKVWGPSLSELQSLGVVQAAKAPASSLHSKEATPEPPGSEPRR